VIAAGNVKLASRFLALFMLASICGWSVKMIVQEWLKSKWNVVILNLETG